jgi:hypothetical protein
VARRRPTAIDPRGGEGIQAQRPTRTRLTTSAGAIAALALAGGDAVIHGGDLVVFVTVLAAAGTLLLLLGVIFRRPAAIPWSLVSTGAAYAIGRQGNPVVDGGAAVVGALLLLAAELAAWSIEDDARIETEPALVTHRAVVVAVLVASALLIDFVLLGTAAVSAATGVLLAAAGVIAAVGAVAIVLRLVRA